MHVYACTPIKTDFWRWKHLLRPDPYCPPFFVPLACANLPCANLPCANLHNDAKDGVMPSGHKIKWSHRSHGLNRFFLSNTLLLSFFTLLLFSAGCFEPVEGDDGSDSSATEDEDEDEDEDENEGEDGGAQPAPDAGSPATDGGGTSMHLDGGQPSSPDSGSPINDAGNLGPNAEDSGSANPPDAGSSMMDHQDGGAMTAPDAGTPITGSEDGGTIIDADAGASTPDAGSPDGGSDNTMPTCTTDLLEWTAHKRMTAFTLMPTNRSWCGS